jgi:hypothetical protein
MVPHLSIVLMMCLSMERNLRILRNLNRRLDNVYPDKHGDSVYSIQCTDITRCWIILNGEGCQKVSNLCSVCSSL